MIPVDALNQWAHAWLGWMGERALASGVALGIVLVFWLSSKRWSTPHLRSWLLLIPLVPLVVSIGDWIPYETPAGQASRHVTNAVQSWVAPAETPRAPATRPEGIQPVAAPSVASMPSHEVPGAYLSGAVLLLGLWSLGFGYFALRTIRAHRRMRRLLDHAVDLSRHPVAKALRAVQGTLGVKRAPRLVASTALRSPATWGWWRPTVILPPEAIETLSEPEMRWVLLHELAHVRRGDLLVTRLQRWVEAAFFFHPVVWIVHALVERERECACDDVATARSAPRARTRGASAFLKVIEMANVGRPLRRPGLLTLCGHRSLLRSRMMRLVDEHRPVRAGLSTSAILGLLACAGLALPASRLVPQEVAQDSTSRVDSDEVAVVAVARSVRWLRAQQQEDGRWRASRVEGTLHTGELNDVGVTGLAIRALLPAAESVDAESRRSIQAGLRWLISSQDPETGMFGKRDTWTFVCSHATGLHGLLEARELLAEDTWRAVGQRAVDFLHRARNPYKGWRFSHLPDGDNDSFVTGIVLLALAAAKDADLHVQPQAIQGGLSFLEEMTDKKTGRTGYNRLGSLPSRLAGKAKDYPAKYSEAPTAIAILVRMANGEEPIESAAIRDGAHLVIKAAPSWDELRGTIDFYHWYWGTRALSVLGGYTWDHWRKNLRTALLPNQRQDAEGGGWWPAVDAWSTEGAEVYATAICTLALQRR